MNVLLLYNSHQTYTNTVFEHIAAFNKYSRFRVFFCHHDQHIDFTADLSKFDVVIIHYTIRLPFDQLSETAAKAIENYQGLKVLFIQDEYDHTHRSWHWIKQLGIKLVFTVVPKDGISRVYPAEEFPGVRFVSNLTGYIPEGQDDLQNSIPPSKRDLLIGYRARNLNIRYGQLGQEKINIGRVVKQYCEEKRIEQDIAWTEEARIYGAKWYEFLGSCRSMLGSESGSNVFDWDGTLISRVETYIHDNPKVSEEQIYKEIIVHLEIEGLMNQVSPRIFEAIASRTVLVLYEGNYSDVVIPGKHYIALKKDVSNLDEVFELLKNGKYVDDMADRAYNEIIKSGQYSYHSFIKIVDDHIYDVMKDRIEMNLDQIDELQLNNENKTTTLLTTSPLRTDIDGLIMNISVPEADSFVKCLVFRVWHFTPEFIRQILRPVLKKIIRIN